MSDTDRLPLFPLGLVLYPGERLPLHIFEPRYRELTAVCLERERPFGILLLEEERLAEVGCTARIVQVVNSYEDGRMDILVVGEQRFRLRTLYDDESYLTGDIDPLLEPDEPVQSSLQERVITQHMRLLELAGRTVRPSLYENVDALSYVIAPNAGLTTQQKQAVLELPTENARMSFLVDHLETLIPQVEQVESLRRQIQSNGHLKDFPPEDLPG